MIKYILLFSPIFFLSQNSTLDSALIFATLKGDEKIYKDISYDLCSLYTEDLTTRKNDSLTVHIWEIIKCQKDDKYFLSGYYAGKPYFVKTEKNSLITLNSNFITVEKLYLELKELSEINKINLQSFALNNSGNTENLEISPDAEIQLMIKKYGKKLGEKIYFIELEPGMKMSMMFDAMNKSYIKRESHTEYRDYKGDWDVYTYKSGLDTYYTVTLLNFKILNFSKTDL